MGIALAVASNVAMSQVIGIERYCAICRLAGIAVTFVDASLRRVPPLVHQEALPQ